MHQENQSVGILMMAYGGPESLAELPGYLADIRRGRVTAPAVLEEIHHNYRRIGGRSPLLAFTQAQVAAVARRFDPERARFYIGMRHWAPWIEDVVGRMIDDGITRAVAVVLAPHYSHLSVAKYHQKVQAGLELNRGEIDFRFVDSYHDAPGLIEAFADRVRVGLAEWPEEARPDVHVVFSAHSLPAQILETDDPYDSQVRETASLVAERAGLRQDQWSWSYQSAGRSPVPWLGPQLGEHLADLAARGVRHVVSVPVGFVCDHVEILYDIDVQAQEIARRLGIRLVRPPALNTDPLFIDQLAELIAARLADWAPAAVSHG